MWPTRLRARLRHEPAPPRGQRTARLRDMLTEDSPWTLLAEEPLAGEGGAEAPLFAAIADRRTYRKDFAEREVPADVLAALARAAAVEGARLEVLGPDQRAAHVSLVAEGDRLQFADPRWRRELASWMHPRRRGEGSSLASWRRPRRASSSATLMSAGVSRVRTPSSRSAPRCWPCWLTDGDTAADWMGAGQALQRVLLIATAAGLQASYLNQPVQVEELRPRVGELLDGPGVPQLVLRLGYPADDVPAAPRRPVDAVIQAPAP